jgi:hypothetical protein
MKTCKDCKFFDQPVEHEGVKYGFCFRFPPHVIAEGKSSAPVVQSEKTWCGEFTLRPKTRK